MSVDRICRVNTAARPELSAKAGINISRMFSPGFAHGFLVLSESAEVLYNTTDYWAAEHERCIRWNDQTLAIDWKLKADPVVSGKDAQGKNFTDAELFI